MSKFIVIEGTDCSGKETQSKLLVESLNKLGNMVFPLINSKPSKEKNKNKYNNYNNYQSIAFYNGFIVFAFIINFIFFYTKN